MQPFDPAREIAADLETPVSAFLKLAELDPVFLLESAAGGESIGRYSFIGLGARHELALEAHELIVDGRFQPFDGDPLGRLRAWLAEADLPSAELPRGPVGLVGYIGYEAAGWLERLPAPKPVPFRLPTAAFVVPRAILAFDHLRSTIRLHPLVDEAEGRALAAEVARKFRESVPR
nr:anthranilate synthase component I [Gemmatimonadota bacterium]